MSLREYVQVIRKRWRIGLVVVLVCLAGGFAYVFTISRKYEATAVVFVSTASATSTNAADLAQGNAFTQDRVQSYTAVANSPSVTAPIVANLHLSMTTMQLRHEISADAPLNKVLINLHVTDRSASQAAQLANAVAAQFSAVVEQLEQAGGSTRSPVRLSVIQPAQVPTAPAVPNTSLDLAIALAAGIVLGLGTAFVRDGLDNTVKDPTVLAELIKLPVLGTIPWDRGVEQRAISFRGDPHGTRAEAFRQMRTNLQFVDVDRPAKIIAVTSAVSGEGKTLSALNLAVALAEGGQDVCLIETDLRKPTLGQTLGIVEQVGLTSVLVGRVDVVKAMQSLGPRLVVLTSGQIPPNPSELVASEQFRTVLDQIAPSVDYIVLDTAPLLPVTDGAEVAAAADATVLIVRADKTHVDQVRRGLATLANVGVTPVGTVLSMAAKRRGAFNYYYKEYRPERRSHSLKRHTT